MNLRNPFVCILTTLAIAVSSLIALYYWNYNIINKIVKLPSTTGTLKTIEELPICNQKDRPRQQAILSTLHAWSLFASQHKIQYWIAYGTLVGYVQRQGLLPHDADTDILMLANDTKYLVPFSDVNFDPTYEIKVHPQWFYVGYHKRSYFHSKGIPFVAPNARFIHRKLRYHVDIWPIYDFDPDQPTKKSNNTKKSLTEYSVSYSWISSPIEWTFPLKECSFSGIRVWCPAMPERLVTNIYGADSVNKTNKICVNGAWKWRKIS